MTVTADLESDARAAHVDDLRRSVAAVVAGVAPELEAETGRRLARELARVADRVPPDAAGGGAVRAVEELIVLRELQRSLDRHGLGERARVARRTSDALRRLRSAPSVAETVSRAASEVCVACGFSRSMISRVDGSMWSPVAVHAGPALDDRHDHVQRVLRIRIPLRSPLAEAEVVRRGTGGLVTVSSARDGRVHAALAHLTGATTYAVAPVVAEGQVIGLVHADAGPGGRALTEKDAEALGAFVTGFGVIVERSILLERLAAQRRRIGSAFTSTATTIGDLCDSEIRLTRQPPRPTTTSDMRHFAEFDAAVSREVPVNGVLTPREREVLGRMARGATNAQIADELVVGVSTVKSHVKHILRKLQASNRAEAVSRYLRMTEHGAAR